MDPGHKARDDRRRLDFRPGHNWQLGRRIVYSAAAWATVGASPATVVRRTSRGWVSS